MEGDKESYRKGMLIILLQLSDKPWATRWDNYLHVLDPSIHWFSLVNSIVIVLFLTGMVAMILIRALHKDISRYNAVDAQVKCTFEVGLVRGSNVYEYDRRMSKKIMDGSWFTVMYSVPLNVPCCCLCWLVTVLKL